MFTPAFAAASRSIFKARKITRKFVNPLTGRLLSIKPPLLL
jgi:hypothetical protein